jgi:hypothetical protein
MKLQQGMFLTLVIAAAGCAQQAEEAADKAKAAAATAESAANKAADEAKKAGDAAVDAAKGAASAASDAAKAASEKISDQAISALQGQFEAAVTSAGEALKGVEGGPEIAKGVADLITNAKSALADVTTSEAATAAAAKIGELTPTLDGLSEKIKGLPTAARTALAAVIESGSEQISSMIAKIADISGVDASVKEKLQEFVKKLSDLTA